jgi:PKHD-type hydroxylase
METGEAAARAEAVRAMTGLVAAENALTAGRPNYFVTGPRLFDDQQLATLRYRVDLHGVPAPVMGHQGQTVATDVRRTRICWLDREADRWVYDLLWTVATTVNQLLRYDIAGTSEDIQIARYDAGEAAFFTWHADTVPSDMTRKISISIPLNEPAEYEGGLLELHQGSNIAHPPQHAGVPIIFPSWLIHRVTPVTRGSRYSLVAWVRGPNWR